MNGSHSHLPSHAPVTENGAFQQLEVIKPEQPILVHACCGPCLTVPARQFLEEKRRFTAWFYNPNIHPAVEHQRRQDAFFELARKWGFPAMSDSESEPDVWMNWKQSKEKRCRMCYGWRLKAAADKTAELGYAGFTTTLLISPWQDHNLIIDIGIRAAAQSGVLFVYHDYRPDYRSSQAMAREAGLYRQRYCGCWPSIEDSKFKDRIYRDLEALEETQESSGNDRK